MKAEYHFTGKHRDYMKKCLVNTVNVAEGAVRSGKTVDNVFAFATLLETAPDRLHLASGVTVAAARLNIGDCNGLGLEAIFAGRCAWSRYRDNVCLRVRTRTGEKLVLFAGGGRADSYRRIRGGSFGMWIATEVDLHSDSFLREAFNRQLAARRRRVFWDLNPGSPNAPIYRDYIDRFAAMEDFPGGFNHRRFTIRDNPAVTPERLREIEAQYEKGSLWYRRDILGERCAAEGLIFPEFAQAPERCTIPWSGLGTEERAALLADIGILTVGVDFGGSRSLTAFVCAGISRDGSRVTILADRNIPGRKGEIDPARVYREFIAFIRETEERFAPLRVRAAFCDSAEQYLINGLRRACRREGLWLAVGDAAKRPVRDRIQCTSDLLASGRMRLLDTCSLVAAGLAEARWDPSAAVLGEDRRLDDFSSDVDILDAEEYAWERFFVR